MRRYVIERDLPGAGTLTTEQLRVVAQTSNAALRALAPDVQWVESNVTADRIYCVYLAESEHVVRDHAMRAGIPVTKVSEVMHVVDPMSGETHAARSRVDGRSA